MVLSTGKPIVLKAGKCQNRSKEQAVTKEGIRRAQQSLEKWRKSHGDISALRKAYRSKIPDWVVKSMEFEREPVSMTRLKKRLSKALRE